MGINYSAVYGEVGISITVYVLQFWGVMGA